MQLNTVDIAEHLAELSYNKPFISKYQSFTIKKMGPTDLYVLFLGGIIGLGIGVGISVIHHNLRQFAK